MSTRPNQFIMRLKEAIDDLIDAARQVAMPRWIWIAGFLYPSVEVSLEVGNLYESVTELGGAAIEFGSEGTQSTRDTLEGLWRELIHGGEIEFGTWIFGVPLILLLLILPLLLLLGRLQAGLAACTSPESWQSSGARNKAPGLLSVWAKGRGMSWSSFGIGVLLGVMRIIAILLLVGAPVLFFQGFLTAGNIEDKSALFAVIYIPLAGVLILYFLILGALHQLALHSLVENRRGMTSALRHAWRLLRVNTPISVSYLLVEISCVLVISLTALAVGLSTAIVCILAPLGFLTILALQGFAGVLRAAFWARAYRSMGGSTSKDAHGGIGASVSQD